MMDHHAHRSTRAPAVVVAVAMAVAGGLLLAACGSGSGTSQRTSLEKAQANVDRAQADLDAAEATFTGSSQAFCGDAKDLISVVDRYGRAIAGAQVTVGDVQNASDDLTTARDDAGSTADEAVADHAAVLEAQAALAEAQADLDAAKAAEAGVTTTTGAASTASTTSTTSTTAPPLVPKATTDRVTAAEDAFASTVKGITPDTPLVTAGVHLSSAAHALEVAWLHLFADAGCITDANQAKAIEAVAAYTTALQQALAAAGYYDGPIDGVYGPSTVEAVEKLQTDAGLPVTGSLDTATSRALDSAVAQKAGSAVAGASARTAGIQGGLKALGYWDGPVDGKPSAALNQAIAQLQSDLGLDPTGVVDPATLDAIVRTVDQAKQPDTSTTAPSTSVPSTTTAPATTSTAAPG